MVSQQFRSQFKPFLLSTERFDDSMLHDGEAWASVFDDLSPSGRHYAISHTAFELFSALRAADPQQATSRVFQLNELVRDRGFPGTQETIEALAIALTCYERCDAPQVQSACARMIRSLVREGLINDTPRKNKGCE